MTLNEMNQYFMHYATCRDVFDPATTVYEVTITSEIKKAGFYVLFSHPGVDSTIDWGDGTAPQKVIGNGWNTYEHIYTDNGVYLLKLKGYKQVSDPYGGITGAIQCANDITDASRMLNGSRLTHVEDTFILPDCCSSILGLCGGCSELIKFPEVFKIPLGVKVTGKEVFYNTMKLKQPIILDCPSVESFTKFTTNTAFTEITFKNSKNLKKLNGMCTNLYSLKRITFDDNSKVTDFRSMTYASTSLKTFENFGWGTGGDIYSGMFSGNPFVEAINFIGQIPRYGNGADSKVNPVGKYNNLTIVNMQQMVDALEPGSTGNPVINFGLRGQELSATYKQKIIDKGWTLEIPA